MRFEVLTVGLKTVHVFLDNNAESTGKSFSVLREERSASRLEPVSPRADCLIS